MNSNLRRLLKALFAELELQSWWCDDADRPDEFDYSFDLHSEFPVIETDDDLPDETDHAGDYPLCVECGNWSHSCVC